MQAEPDSFEEGPFQQTDKAGANGDCQTQTDSAVQVGTDSAPNTPMAPAQNLKLKSGCSHKAGDEAASGQVVAAKQEVEGQQQEYRRQYAIQQAKIEFRHE